MRRLFILRHAEAAPAADDRQRPLTPKGKRDANVLGQKLKALKMFPDYVVCSPARRTRETYMAMEEHLPEVSCIYPEYLYNAETERLIEAVKNLSDSAESVMIIAHNPGIHNLARVFSQKGDHEPRQRLSYGYKPCSLAIVESKSKRWAEIDPAKCTLVSFLES